MDFAEFLGLQLALQAEGLGIDLPGFNTEERVNYIHYNTTGISAEIHEALDETSWKPWANGDPYINRDLYMKELIDALHFLGNLFLVVMPNSPTPIADLAAEIEERYKHKRVVNIKRQEDGYDGKTGKCPGCKRALEDVDVRVDIVDDVETASCGACGHVLEAVT